jgi:hypothetical protein
LVSVTQPNVGSDFNDIPRVMSRALFVLIRAQQECPAVEDPAWNDADRHSSAVLVRFEAYDIRRK